jgi:PAS domain S-box-containing protein
MNQKSQSRFLILSKNFPQWASAILVSIACVVLAGWTFNLAALKRIVPGTMPMNPTVALCFILSGVSLYLSQTRENGRQEKWRTRIAQICAFVIVLIASAKVGNYLFALNLQLDRHLFPLWIEDHRLTGGLNPNQIAPNAALNFLACGLALLLLDVEVGKSRRPAQYFIVLVCCVSWLSLVGYFYNAEAVFAIDSFRPMAPHTALPFLILALGLAFLRPQTGLMASLTSPGAGGIMARRLLPAAILVPTVLGGVRLLGGQTAHYDREFSASILVVCNIFIFGVIIWWNAASLNRMERERDRAGKVVGDSEKRFRSLWENSAEGMRLTDGDGKILEVNPAFCKLAGMEAGKLVGRPLSVIYHEDQNPERHLRNYRERFAQRSIDTNLERCIKFRSGQSVDLDFTNSFVEVEGEQPVVLTIFRDVTERKRAEAEIRHLNGELEERVEARTLELRESEQRYHFLTDTLPQIIWTAKPDGSIDYFNQRWFDYTGLTLEATKNWGWQRVLHAEDSPACIERWTLAIQTGVNYEGEARFRHAGGSHRWHLVRAFPLHNRRKEIVQWIGTCTDIHDFKQAEEEIRKLNESLEKRVVDRTLALERANRNLEDDIAERKRVEAALRESEERFRTLAAASPIGIFQTNPNGKCVYANEKWLSIAGLTLNECLGETWARAVHPDDREGTAWEWSKCAREERDFSREFRVQTPAGPVRWVHSYAAAIRAQGKVVGYVGTIEDISERKQAEEQLKRFAWQVEQSNHELKEALNNVKTLRGLLPICSGCKKIRDDKGYWNQIEFFIRDHSDANFSHGMCPECTRNYFPGVRKKVAG